MNKDEINNAKREKQIAIIKASNELLEQAKNTMLKSNKISELEKHEQSEQINEAINENIEKGKVYLKADKDEIDNIKYNEVSEDYKKEYYENLKKRGITEEQISKKELADVVVVDYNEDSTNKKRRRNKKSEDFVIKRVENEEEIMKMTMVKDFNEFKKKKQNIDEKIDENLNIKNEKGKEKINIPENDDIYKEPEKIGINNILNNNNLDYSFGDLNTIPSYIQYDVIPLPSNGMCYPETSPLRCGRIPVSYLTASDENLIASPNLYRDGKIIDIILSRKILDKRIDINSLCSGDRDAIILWLRATGYGIDYPVIVTNPSNGKQYNINVDLSQFKYKPFNLKSNKNGLFEYKIQKLDGTVDVIEYKYFTKKDDNIIRNKITDNSNSIDKKDILKYSILISDILKNNFTINEDVKKEISDCVEDVKDIINEISNENEIDVENYDTVTSQMFMHTISINGNDNPEYVKAYVSNMRAKDAFKYREYINKNKPGIDFRIKVNIPEADGGGQFETFFRIIDSIFINL